MKILVINGVNLNKLGKRDINQYGTLSLEQIELIIRKEFPEMIFEFIQSNSEEGICTLIHNPNKDFDGIIINPGAFTHTSVAIRDAIEVCVVPVIEVHLSNISARESFRKVQITSSKAAGYISGFKENSYLAAVYILKKVMNTKI